MTNLVSNLLKWGFPILIITDLSSQLYSSSIILNFSRSLRIFMLLLFILENIKYYKIVQKFYFFRFFMTFNFIMFVYVFTDRNPMEGFWIFSKILFWILGLNIFFLYKYLNIFNFQDLVILMKKNIIISFIFTLLFFFTGFMKQDYNVAAYSVLFCYPIILLSSKGFSKNYFHIFFAAVSILLTLKRGAMLAFFFANIIYILFIFRDNFSPKKLFFVIIVFSSMISVGQYVYTIQKSEHQSRFSQDQFDINNDNAGSGRVGLYNRLFSLWLNSDIETKIFGFGNQEDTYLKRGRRTHAHSDIFGFLYNHGLLGLFLLFFLYYKIIRYYFFVKRFNINSTIIIPSLLIILILVNIYSGLMRSTEALFIFALLPFLQFKFIDEKI